MKILDYYLLKNIIKSILLALLILVSVFAFFSFLDELKEAGTKFYSAKNALLYVGFQLPYIAYTLGYISILIGVIISIGNINSNKELQIYLTAGVSIMSITKKTIAFSIFLSLFFTLIGELSSYSFSSMGDQLKSKWLSKPEKIINFDNYWVKKNNKFIHFGSYTNPKEIKDVGIFEVSENKLNNFSISDSAYLKNNNLTLSDVVVFSNFGQGGLIVKKEFNNKNESFETEELREQQISPQKQSFLELWKHISFLESNQIDTKNYRLELYNRLFRPINLISLIILALPFVMSFDRSISLGNRVFIGIFLALIMNLITKVISQLTLRIEDYHFLIMLTISALILIICLILARVSIKYASNN